MFDLAFSDNILASLKFKNPTLSNNQLWEMHQHNAENPIDYPLVVDPSIIPTADFKSDEQCPKCKNNTVTIIEEQTGGLDEGSKQVINCLTCGYLSKTR